jgi:hypothetical protein
VLVATGGNNAYVINRGGGASTIFNAVMGGGTSPDQIDFGSSVAHDQLWFSQTGNDLVVSVIGTNDRATVADWFTDPTAQVDKIVAGDGYTLVAAQVQALVSAMGPYGLPAAGQTSLNAQQHAALDPAIAANWHH